MTINLTTLPGGLRVVTDSAKGIESLAIGVWAGVGTRHEAPHQNGIAHMLEHMLFKGTPTRTSKEISDVIEDAGGHFNAYTGRETTAYYIRILDEHLDLSLDVLSDMLLNSTFPEEEIDRERAVILQEIKMYEDSPDDLVFDYALKSAFPDQALGASGLGTPEIVNSITAMDLQKYIGTHYAADRLVISCAGDIDHDFFVGKVQKFFTRALAPNMGKNITGYAPARYAPLASLIEKDTEQAHLIIGFEGLSRPDPRYPAQRILSSILGGGTSSRLWQEIREKHGLVYSIHSFQDSYQDGGLFGVYAGTGPEELGKLVPLMIDQIRSMCDHVTDQELSRAKTQIISSTRMAREKMMTRADQQGRYVLNHETIFEVAPFMERIHAVTAEDITGLARIMIETPLLLSAIGPIKGLPAQEKIEAQLKS